MHSISFNSALLLALSLTASAQVDFDQIFGSGDNSNCDGTSIQGYCCPGSVLSDGSYSNNNDFDPSGLTCCVGDPNHSFNNGPESCSAGTPTPLTAVSGAASTGATSATMSKDVSSMSMDSEASMTMTMTSMGMSSMETMMSSASMTGGASVSSMTDGAEAQSTSSDAASSSSTAGAVRAIVTGAPVLGAAAAGMLALL